MITEKNNTSPIDVSLFRTRADTINLSSTKDWLKDYDWVTVHVWWTGFDDFTGGIYLREKRSSKVPDWAFEDVPGQMVGITDQFGDLSGRGRHIFRDVDLHCTEIALYIDRNTATVGSVYYDIAARKQYGRENIVEELKNAVSLIRELKNAITNLGAR